MTLLFPDPPRCPHGFQYGACLICQGRAPRDGATFDPDRDGRRLGAQAAAVWTLMEDGRWRTLAAISEATGYPEASVSARLRDLRKPRFGGHRVERRNAGGGTWEYRVGGQRETPEHP